MKKVFITGGTGTIGKSFIEKYYDTYEFYSLSRNEKLIAELKHEFPKVKCYVGSICNGKFTPMSLSDYTVGTNHILPTSGSAKFSSGLSINEFIKKISIVTLSKLGVEKIGNPAIKLSEYENLYAHTQSIKSRM